MLSTFRKVKKIIRLIFRYLFLGGRAGALRNTHKIRTQCGCECKNDECLCSLVFTIHVSEREQGEPRATNKKCGFH